MTTTEKTSTGKCASCGSRLNHEKRQQKYCSPACSANGRRITAGKWRLTASKICPVCDQRFKPTPTITMKAWRLKNICDRFCGAAAGQGRRIIMADPLDQVQPHQRLKWLRLSESKCGKKLPWSIEVMAKDCKLSGSAIWHVECDGGVTGEWIPAAAQRLRVNEALFTVSVERFAKIVNAAGLTAKLSVPVKGGAK